MGGQWEVSGKPEASKRAFVDCLPGGWGSNNKAAAVEETRNETLGQTARQP